MQYRRAVGFGGLLVWVLIGCFSNAPRAMAQGGSWADTFTAAAFSSQVQAGSTRVIVVAAGADRTAAKEATTAIEARLRALSAALVMSDDALGAVSDLDDAAIVSRAAPMPVDRVLVVRVFAGAAGAAPSAVAILYLKDGNVVTALNGTRGQPIAATPTAATAPVAPVAPTSVPSGVDSRAADTVSEITRNHQTSREDAQRQYDEQYVAFDEMAAVTTGGNVVATWTVPYQGKYRKPLEGEDFYIAVERNDLADKYRGRNTLKWGLFAAGLTTIAVGGVIAIYGFSNMETDRCEQYDFLDHDKCAYYETDLTLGFVGMGIVIVGIPVAFLSPLINPHPVEPTEARRIADEHNRRLRDRLGLSSDTAALRIPQAPTARFSWDAYAMPRGAGLSLRLDL